MTKRKLRGVKVHDEDDTMEQKINSVSKNVDLYPIFNRNPDLQDKVNKFLTRSFTDLRFKWKTVRLVDSIDQIVSEPEDIGFFLVDERYVDVLIQWHNEVNIIPLFNVQWLQDDSSNNGRQLLHLCVEIERSTIENQTKPVPMVLTAEPVWSKIKEALIRQYRVLLSKQRNFCFDEVDIILSTKEEKPQPDSDEILEWIGVKGDPEGENIVEIAENDGKIFIHLPDFNHEPTPTPTFCQSQPMTSFDNPLSAGPKQPMGSSMGGSSYSYPHPYPGPYGPTLFGMHHSPWDAFMSQQYSPNYSDSFYGHEHWGNQKPTSSPIGGSSEVTINFIDWVTANVSSVEKCIKILAAENATYTFQFVTQTQNIPEPIRDVRFYPNEKKDHSPIVVCVGECTFYIVVSGWDKGIVTPKDDTL